MESQYYLWRSLEGRKDGSIALTLSVSLPGRGLLPRVDLSPDDDILKPEDVGDDGGVPDHQVLRYLPALNAENNPL